MVARAKHRGHGMHFDEDRQAWVYDDGGTVSENEDRPCGYCGLSRTPEGHDGCLGTLPGVRNACCGHGGADDAYVQTEEGLIAGSAALQFFTLHAAPTGKSLAKLQLGEMELEKRKEPAPQNTAP